MAFSPWSRACLFAVLLPALLSMPSRLVLAIGADPSAFQIQTASETTGSGPLQELGDGWRVRLGGPKPIHTEAADLIELRRSGKLLPGLPDGEQLLLANGDRIPGTVLGLAGEHLRFRPCLVGPREEDEVRVPLAAVSVVWLAAPEGARHGDQRRRQLASEKRTRDIVYLRNGDTVEGIVSGLGAKSVEVEVEKKVVEVKREQVSAIALNTELATSLRPREPFARLVLANGCRLSVASASCADGKTLAGTTLFKTPLRIPVSELIVLYVHQAKAVYLSDLKPARYEHTPFLRPTPFAVDANTRGRDLRLRGNTFDKGLGIPSESRLTYDLAGGYQRFEALVGLDEFEGRQGSVRIVVLVDGKARDLGWDRELTWRDGSLPVRLDVTGARELTLVVAFGQGGPVQDHVNWADARLIQDPRAGKGPK